MARSTGKMTGIITGLIIGGIAGGIFALLYTPYNGRKMRKMISKKTDGIMDDVKDYVSSAEEVLKEGRKKVNSIIDDAKKMVTSYWKDEKSFQICADVNSLDLMKGWFETMYKRNDHDKMIDIYEADLEDYFKYLMNRVNKFLNSRAGISENQHNQRRKNRIRKKAS